MGATTVPLRVWLLLAGLAGADFVWCQARGFVILDWWPVLAVGVLMLGFAASLRRVGPRWSRLAAIAEWIWLWIVFSCAGALLTYLAAAHDGPLYDSRVAPADGLLGFDWNAWHAFVLEHRWLKWPLAIAYGSLVPQIMLSVLWFAWRGWDRRNAELLTQVSLALIVTTAMFWRFPTLGPCAGLPGFDDVYVSDLQGLRHGTLPTINLMVMKGVVAFPSFHAVLAVLFAYAHRQSPTLLPFAVFNAVMLASVPSEGGHYLTDLFGGIAVALLTIGATRFWPVRLPIWAPVATG